MMPNFLPTLSTRKTALILSLLLHMAVLAEWKPFSTELMVNNSGVPSLPLALHFSLLNSQSPAQATKAEKQRLTITKTDIKETAVQPPREIAKPQVAQQKDGSKPRQSEQTVISQQAAVQKQSKTVGLQSIPVIKQASYRYPPKPPVYPRLALQRRQQGEVLIHARVNAEGETEQLQLVQSSGYRLLDQSAMKAVEGWLFLPAWRNGVPIVAWIEVPVSFEIR